MCIFFYFSIFTYFYLFVCFFTFIAFTSSFIFYFYSGAFLNIDYFVADGLRRIVVVVVS